MDAAIDDYFKFDNSGETKETEKIHEHLNTAWDNMDSALDELQCLIKGVTSLNEQASPADPDEPEPVLTDETFRSMLRNITPETLRETHKATIFFDEQLENEEGQKLTDNAKGLFIAALLIEHGKQKAKKECSNNENRAKQKPCQCANTDRATALKTNHGIRAN